MIGVPSRFRLTRKVVSLSRMFPTLGLNYTENTVRWKWKSPLVEYGRWTPESSKKRSVSRWSCKNKRITNSLCNLPDVLEIGVLNEVVLGGLLFCLFLVFLWNDKVRDKDFITWAWVFTSRGFPPSLMIPCLDTRLSSDVVTFNGTLTTSPC